MTAARATGVEPWTPTELVTVMAARRLATTGVAFAGIGIPSAAAILARHTVAHDLYLVFESGTLGPRPTTLPRSVADEGLASTAHAIVSLPEVFSYWLAPERIELGILGAGQVDRFGNVNSTTIGEYSRPRVRLPGAGGAPEIMTACRATMVVALHSPRVFVERVDFVTTLGHGDGAGHRARLGLQTKGPKAVVTDLGVLEPDPETAELTLTALRHGATVDMVRGATGWHLAVAETLTYEPAPTDSELATLRGLERAAG